MTHEGNSAASLRATVWEILSDVLRMPVEDIDDQASLVEELRLDGDDFSFLVVPKLERALGISLRDADWSTVRTASDLYNAVAEYRSSAQ